MKAGGILISFAILLLAAAMWNDWRANDRVTPARKTYLIVACIFAAIHAALQLLT